ncbi:MAG: hypothetical protein WD489_11065 [Rhodovibrionaceae bacterium]
MTGPLHRAAHALVSLWRGARPLGEAFWLWAVLGAAAVNFGTSALFLALISAGHPVIAWIAGYALSIPYNVLALVGVWRSADSYEGAAFWAHAARSIALVGLVVISVF